MTSVLPGSNLQLKSPDVEWSIDEVVTSLSGQSERLICELTESAKDQLSKCIESLTGSFATKLDEEILNLRARYINACLGLV